MAKHITSEQLFDGVFSFAKDCISNKRAPLDQLEYSNGYSGVDFNFMISNSKKPELELSCMIQVMNYENIKPASKLYIAGYNARAVELGMPLYNSFGILVKLVSMLIILRHCCIKKRQST